jgi:hypothetical protein
MSGWATCASVGDGGPQVSRVASPIRSRASSWWWNLHRSWCTLGIDRVRPENRLGCPTNWMLPGGTRLTLTHSGFDTTAGLAAIGICQGWETSLARLAQSLEGTELGTRDVVWAYHRAFHEARDRDAVRRLLSDKGAFIGPLNAFDDADMFLDGAAVFIRLSKEAKVKALIVDGVHACLAYDYTTEVASLPPIPIASVFRVEQGRINLFHTHFNPMSFLAAKERGDVDRALAAITK